jgi:ribonuclease D
MTIITTTDELAALCKTLHNEQFITVDTEFLRDKTYYPQLCLIQIATDHHAYAIDSLAPGLDLSPLGGLFANPAVIKVFHSARQDIEILLALFGAVPTPLFDTQVAAMVCGFGDSASYETLATKLANATIDKSSRFTDWTQRPLSEKQYLYALSDVTHLRTVYRKLVEMLEQTDRTQWLSDEMASLTNPDNYQLAPEDAWKKIKMRSSSPQFTRVVKGLAEWRELKAREVNIPRNHLLKEAILLEIAAAAPANGEELKRIRNLGGLNNNEGFINEVIAIIHQAVHGPKDPAAAKSAPRPSYLATTPLVELLRVLLKMQCEQHNIAEKMIAVTDDLLQIAHTASDSINQLPVMNGWRYEIFGKLALELKEGKIALSANQDKITLVPLAACK